MMSGWRKRTIMEMARESWIDVYGLGHDRISFVKALEAFAELVRADERKKFLEALRQLHDCKENEFPVLLYTKEKNT
jgi:hypothetical protein